MQAGFWPWFKGNGSQQGQKVEIFKAYFVLFVEKKHQRILNFLFLNQQSHFDGWKKILQNLI
jgi:hypothetical protein